MRKIHLYIFSALLLTGLFGSCRQTNDAAADYDSTALKLAVLPTIECLPFYYADSLGLFEAAGLPLRLVTFKAAMDADTAFANGGVDGIVSDMVKACIWQSDSDSLHMPMCGDLRLWLVAASGTQMTKTSSLKEKIFAITRNSALDFFIDQLQEKVGLQPLDINRPQINNLQLRMSMVDQNQMDGAVLPEPYASETVARGATRLYGSDELMLNGMMCVLFADSVGRQRHDDLAKLRQVYDQAVDALNTDTIASVLDFIPAEHRTFLPDTLFTNTPFTHSHAPNDSLVARIKTWAKGRSLIK